MSRIARNRMLALPAIALAICSLAGCAPLGKLSPLGPVERNLVFQPAKYPAGDWEPKELAFEDAWFTAADGTKLHGWFVPHENPRGVALVCHGNAGNLTMMAKSLQILQERHHLSVMTFDYRGFGRSEGKPSEQGVLQDARAARAWLAERTGVPEGEIILMGQSLGGAVAIDLAAKDGARALILASTFTSLPDVGAFVVPWLLPRWNMTLQMNSLEKIKEYPGPVLISHGDADRLIPMTQGIELYHAAPGHKRFFREAGAGHNDPRSEAYRVALEEFLSELETPAEIADR